VDLVSVFGLTERGVVVDKATVVDALCAGLKLPGIGDTVERAAITRCVAAIYDHVPLFVWGIVVSAADGIQEEEIDSLLGSISRTLAARANMPWVPVSIRKQVIDQILATLRTSLQVDDYLEALAK
jgi:hypothetical protein